MAPKDPTTNFDLRAKRVAGDALLASQRIRLSLELPDDTLLIQGRPIKIRSGYCELNRPIVNGTMHFPAIACVVSSDDLDPSIGRDAAILIEVRIA
jgi:hypothetical protein